VVLFECSRKLPRYQKMADAAHGGLISEAVVLVGDWFHRLGASGYHTLPPNSPTMPDASQ